MHQWILCSRLLQMQFWLGRTQLHHKDYVLSDWCRYSKLCFSSSFPEPWPSARSSSNAHWSIAITVCPSSSIISSNGTRTSTRTSTISWTCAWSSPWTVSTGFALSFTDAIPNAFADALTVSRPCAWGISISGTSTRPISGTIARTIPRSLPRSSVSLAVFWPIAGAIAGSITMIAQVRRRIQHGASARQTQAECAAPTVSVAVLRNFSILW
mmetsp:Transcript_49183/g.77757  ORF Transcript_49183/g.77757 Transcript_49183/m.77757 type:complete len:212 (+) Transcript_49183:455-1090(+)